MSKEIERAFKNQQAETVIGVDQTKINDMIGTIIHRAGQVWQN